MKAEELYLAEDHEFDYRLQRRSTTSRVLGPATGLVGLRCWLSATLGGDPLDDAVDVAVTEAGDAPGTYFGSIPQPAVEEWVGSLQTVFRVFGIPGEVLVSTRLRVRPIRTVSSAIC